MALRQAEARSADYVNISKFREVETSGDEFGRCSYLAIFNFYIK